MVWSPYFSEYRHIYEWNINDCDAGQQISHTSLTLKINELGNGIVGNESIIIRTSLVQITVPVAENKIITYIYALVEWENLKLIKNIISILGEIETIAIVTKYYILIILYILGSLMRVQYPKCAYGPYC